MTIILAIPTPINSKAKTHKIISGGVILSPCDINNLYCLPCVERVSKVVTYTSDLWLIQLLFSFLNL